MLLNWKETDMVLAALKRKIPDMRGVSEIGIIRSYNLSIGGIKSVSIHPKYHDFEMLFLEVINGKGDVS